MKLRVPIFLSLALGLLAGHSIEAAQSYSSRPIKIVVPWPSSGTQTYCAIDVFNTVTINPSLYAKLPFDLQRDFAPVGMIASVPMILVTNPKQPYRTLEEFMTFAKEHPKTINFSSPSSGHHSTLPERSLDDGHGPKTCSLKCWDPVDPLGKVISGI